MAFTFYMPEIFGYSAFFEACNYPLEGKLLDWESCAGDTEIWLFGKCHIVISNERYYREVDRTTPEG
jgi:hypothetical protein